MGDLDRLENTILKQLAMVGEGATLDYDRPTLHRAHPGSTEPAGAFSGDLSPQVSLALYHHQKLLGARQKGLSVRLTALAEASRDLETTKHRPPTYNSPDSEQNAQERDQAILTVWAGYRPEWPAVFENCSESYVRKLRRRCKRNPMTGELTEEAAA